MTTILVVCALWIVGLAVVGMFVRGATAKPSIPFRRGDE